VKNINNTNLEEFNSEFKTMSYGPCALKTANENTH